MRHPEEESMPERKSIGETAPANNWIGVLTLVGGLLLSTIGEGEIYMRGADGKLMPAKKPPDLQHFDGKAAAKTPRGPR